MNLKAIRLRNFRGFRDASIELKPLTVLLGPNSAGKSAFGHALAAMAHAQSEYKDTGRATLSPRDNKAAENWPIDFGQHADLCTKGVADRVHIDLKTREGWFEFGFGGLESVTGLVLSYIKHPLGRHDSFPVQTSLNEPILSPEGAVSGASAITPLQIETSGSEIELIRRKEQYWHDEKEQSVRVGLNGLLVDTVSHETGTTILLDSMARLDVKDLLEHVTYLRASRKRPCRGYERRTSNDGSLIGYAGEWTASLLMDSLSNQVVKDPVTFRYPSSIPNSVAEAQKLIDVPWKQRHENLLDAAGTWLQHLGLAGAIETRVSPRDSTRIEVRVTMNQSWGARDITEIGYGISQVLPVLVGGLLQPEKGLFIVDLPEAHLHPKPQAELADFFCSLALSGRPCLVETHSEMFFHRLRLRAAMNKDLMGKIAVYFCDPPQPDGDGACSNPRKIGLDLGEDLQWPVDFFQEAWEMETQISAVREARRVAADDQTSA